MHKIKIFLFILISSFFLACNSDTTSSQHTTPSFYKIACIGDSITEGLKLSDPSTQSYPAQLSAKLQNENKGEAINFGRSGATALKNGNRPYIYTSQYTQSLSYEANTVILMLGTNDVKNINWGSKDNFIDDYTSLINQYKRLPTSPKIYICLPPPVFGNIQGITNQRIENELIPYIQEVAKRTNSTIIDLHTIFLDKKDLFPDLIHPNIKGARIIAETIYNTLNKNKKE
jgi:lysophospholipase L1-like esterase